MQKNFELRLGWPFDARIVFYGDNERTDRETHGTTIHLDLRA